MSWRLAHGLEKLRSQVNEKWPLRSKDSDGSIGDEHHSARASDHNPDSGFKPGGAVAPRQQIADISRNSPWGSERRGATANRGCGDYPTKRPPEGGLSVKPVQGSGGWDQAIRSSEF